MSKQARYIREYGGVSIFIVIFTALLVTIVTASFAQLMVRNQQQASANDLSQSAYDSALAGVEDAKRALVRLQECENKGSEGENCANTIRNAFDDSNQGCDSLQKAQVASFVNGEVGVGSPEQNQAYTCVKVQLDTSDYKDDGIASGVPVVVPLKSKESFDSVRISWFTQADLDKASSNSGVNEVKFPNPDNLLPNAGDGVGEWPTYAPALLRAQLIQFEKGSISLKEFNKKDTPNARTLFLYPYDRSPMSEPANLTFSDDSRRNSTTQNVPQGANCNTTFTLFNGYACQVQIALPDLPGGGEREAYLQLQSYYQQYTSFKVELIDGDTNKVADLHEVQPKIDSTGRASSLFRRVEANVSLRNNGVSLQYPDAALSINGGLCKNFFVTDRSDEYRPREDSICSDG